MHHQYSSSVSPFHTNTGTPFGFSAVPSRPTATAAAAWSWVEKMLQLTQRTSRAEVDEGLDEHRGLDRHVQRAHDPRAGQRLAGSVLGPAGHEAGHLHLGQFDLLAPPFGKREIRDFEVALGPSGPLSGGLGPSGPLSGLACVVVIWTPRVVQARRDAQRSWEPARITG